MRSTMPQTRWVLVGTLTTAFPWPALRLFALKGYVCPSYPTKGISLWGRGPPTLVHGVSQELSGQQFP